MPENPPGGRRTFVDRDPLMSYPAFDLVRDPSLLPSGRERDIQTLWRTIERYRAKLEPLGVLQGLSPHQQKELAALVLDLDVSYDIWANAKDYYRRLKVRSKRGPGHVRKLAHKLAQIRINLQALARDAQKVDKEFADHVVPAVNEAIAILTRVTLIPARETEQQYSARLSGFYEQSRSQRLQSDDPHRHALKRLFEYFRKSSSCPAADAEVRTATIGNERWQWNYKISANDAGTVECAAVRALLGRARSRRHQPDSALTPPAQRRSLRQRTVPKKRG